MKHLVVLLIILSTLSIAHLARAQNPFSAKTQHNCTTAMPVVANNLFVKINVWQHQLRTKMAALVRQAKSGASVKPLLFLIVVAFAYGAVHAAGPGHGKAIALSYVLSQRPSYFQGMLFSNILALIHGGSGIVFVITVRFVLQTNVVRNLATVTNITQVASYAIVACFGCAIFVHTIYKLVKIDAQKEQSHKNFKSQKHKNPVLLALVVGGIPCPGVIMVMLFAMSMDMIALGVILGIAISMGMALTVSIVVLIAMSVKNTSLGVIVKNSKRAIVIEYGVELFAGLTLMILGVLFLVTSLGSFPC